MRSEPASLFEDMANDVVGELETVIHEFTEDIRQKISVPVGRSAKGRPIRSNPGEYPRLDKGVLAAGLTSDIKRTGDTVEARVYDNVGYAGILEQMDRKLLTDSAQEFEDKCVDAVIRAVNAEGE